jgi:hypothetical protein
MAVDLRVVLPNRPGTVIQVLEAVASEGINVEGFCGDIRPGERWGYIHLLVEDGPAATRAIERAGYEVTGEHKVDILKLDDEPGALAKAAARYSREGRNMEVLYVASGSRIVIGTEDMQDERLGVRMKDARY